MKIEIPGYIDVDLQDLKDDIGNIENWLYKPDLIKGLINKIEELQSEISTIKARKTCAKCEHLIVNTATIDDPYTNYMCVKGGWTGVENVEDLGESVDCEHFREAQDE